MSSSFYGPDAVWPELASVGDSFFLDSDGKSVFASPTDDTNLEEVVRILADDDFEIKLVWNEADHPRDDRGRFASGGGLTPYTASQLHKAIIYTNFNQIHQEQRSVHNAAQKLFGFPSRWKGEFALFSLSTLNAAGSKEWTCRITLAYEILPIPARKLSTMFHESLHAMAVTGAEEYKQAKGWEEGTIDSIVRHFRPQIAQQMGWNITSEEFDERDKGHMYSPLAKSIEQIRVSLREHSGLAIYDPHPFYSQLLMVPANEKQEFIRRQADTNIPSPKALRAFNLTFDRNCRVLNDYEKDTTGSTTPGHIKGQTHPMTRDELVKMMFSTQSREEVIATQQAMTEWLEEHPDDSGIFEGGEMIAMLANAYGIKHPDEDKYVAPFKHIYDELAAQYMRDQEAEKTNGGQ